MLNPNEIYSRGAIIISIMEEIGIIMAPRE
jgi:hypothetical protein